MANFNKVFLMGNLTREPELRVTPGGLSICKFGLAVNRVFSDREGNKKEETTFVDIDSFGKQAELISKYMTKGRPIFVEGRLRLDQWETNTGDKRSRMVVVLDNFQFLGGREGGQGGQGGGDYQSSSEDGGDNEPTRNPEKHSPPPRPASKPASSSDDVEEDVPF